MPGPKQLHFSLQAVEQLIFVKEDRKVCSPYPFPSSAVAFLYFSLLFRFARGEIWPRLDIKITGRGRNRGKGKGKPMEGEEMAMVELDPVPMQVAALETVR